MQTNKVRPEPKIPDHEVLRKIGGGAYGEVWLAQGVTGALRAVKTVWHNDFEDERGFEREFEGILKYEPISRDHPGLVHILHVGRGEAEGEPFYYYVMELGDDVTTGREINPVEYEPRTLRSDVKVMEGKALDVEECISAGRVLAEGLEHLHQHGLAHRDVKPSNVIFVDGKAKLADIGLVALRGQQTFVGTEGFVPPEGPGSAQADVYSLGKVLYEMATGKDRLEFPELPDELPEGQKLKRWRRLNSIICDVCEPRISRRKIKTAGDLAIELGNLEAGRRRPVRLSPGWIATLLVVALGFGVAGQMIGLEPVTISSRSPVRPVEMANVQVLSEPEGAEVIDDDGKNLGRTYTEPIAYPVGAIVSFTLTKQGYRDLRLEGEVSPTGLVLNGKLERYSPPEPQSDWTDVFGTAYQPLDDHHVSRYYVSADAWERYQGATGAKDGAVVALTENGMMNEVVIAREQEARGYTAWLEKECRQNGYLDEEHWIEPMMDQVRTIPGITEDGSQDAQRPFYCVVRREYTATVYVGSEPPGAFVIIDNEYMFDEDGNEVVTTEDGVRVDVNLGRGPKTVELILEKPEYKRFSQRMPLRPDEQWDKALIVPLELEDIFSDRRMNSLGMQLVPVRATPELLVSIWETRIQDYQAFLAELEKKEPVPKAAGAARDYALLVNTLREEVTAPPGASFVEEQELDHPVVNVTRNDAMQFCRWLTLKERKSKDLEELYEYRLPTDAEWSKMVGLREDEDQSPLDLHALGEGFFFWGDSFPPPPGSGNFSDQSAALVRAQDVLIGGYDDGFAFTSPVGRYLGTDVGGGFMLYDLAGNVMEWVSDDYTAKGEFNVARGACWNSYEPKQLKMSVRRPVAKNVGLSSEFFEVYGFRVVLAKVPVNTEKKAEENPDR